MPVEIRELKIQTNIVSKSNKPSLHELGPEWLKQKLTQEIQKNLKSVTRKTSFDR